MSRPRTMQDVKRRLIPAAAAALALVALSGCDQSSLTAAHVGSESISVTDLDLLTQALCAEQLNAQGAEGRPPSAVSTTSGSALTALIESAIDRQYADRHQIGYDRVSLAKQVGQLDSLISHLPAKDQDRTRELITDLFRGQIQMFQAATSQVQAAGKAPNQQLVQQEMSKIEASYAKTLDIKVNPRFDPAGPGHGGDGFQSLSQAVSTTGKNSTSQQPDAGWVADLPAGQKCG